MLKNIKNKINDKKYENNDTDRTLNYENLINENSEIKTELKFLKNKYEETEKTNQKLHSNIDDLKCQYETLLKKYESYTNETNTKLKNIKKDFDNYKNNNEKIINSYYDQFNNIFLYYDLKVKGLLKYNHILNQEVLNFVVNICNKYDLSYWLDYGLLLGAVRHQGFIPWDDDLDIGMMRKDYNILLNVIDKEIKEHDLYGLLRIYRNIGKYKPLPILQLLYYGYPGTIIAGIDIFPYDFVENKSNCNEKNYYSIQKTVNATNRKGVPIDEALEKYFNLFDIHYNEKEYIIPGIEGGRGIIPGYKFDILETNKILPLKKIEFNHKQYYAPNDYHYYLKRIYGNYLDIPKIIRHHHGRFDKLRKNDNAKEIFEKHIKLMKKANESYEE